MDRTDLVEILQDCGLGSEAKRSKLTLDKVERRARNIREVSGYVIFQIERHPWVGEGWEPSGADVTVQTWRISTDHGSMELVCEFHARSYLDQNDLGDPVCAHCDDTLDPFGQVFEYVWRCNQCGAIGGKKEEIFDPSLGVPLIQDEEDWDKLYDKPVWIPANGD